MFLNGMKLNLKKYGDYKVTNIHVFGNRSCLILQNNTALIFGGDFLEPELIKPLEGNKLEAVGIGQDWEIVPIKELEPKNITLSE